MSANLLSSPRVYVAERSRMIFCQSNMAEELNGIPSRCQRYSEIAGDGALRHTVGDTGYRQNMSIGKRIRELREAQHMTRIELAKAMGVAVTTLSDLELGESKSTTALHKAAAKLGTTPEYLETGRHRQDTFTPHKRPSTEAHISDDEIRPLRIILHSLVTALTANAPGVARQFAAVLSKRAHDAKITDPNEDLRVIAAIVSEGQKEAEETVQEAERFVSARTSSSKNPGRKSA